MTGAMFGIIGGVIGGAIAAGSINAGQKRTSSVTRQHRNIVAPLIRRNIEGALAGTGKLPASTGKPGEVELRLKSVNHGLGHSGGQRFAPIVAARYELWDGKGKRIYKGAKEGTSEVGWTQAEYHAKPQLYVDGLERASQAMGRDLAIEMIDELEEWLEQTLKLQPGPSTPARTTHARHGNEHCEAPDRSFGHGGGAHRIHSGQRILTAAVLRMQNEVPRGKGPAINRKGKSEWTSELIDQRCVTRIGKTESGDPRHLRGDVRNAVIN